MIFTSCVFSILKNCCGEMSYLRAERPGTKSLNLLTPSKAQQYPLAHVTGTDLSPIQPELYVCFSSIFLGLSLATGFL
jgi:hypothetical protein